MQYFILVVAILVNGEVDKNLVAPVAAYDSVEACLMAGEKFTKIAPPTVHLGKTFEFSFACPEQSSSYNLNIHRSA